VVFFISVIVLKNNLPENTTDLEAIFGTKLQDYIPPLSGCVCSVKNLWKDTAVMIYSSFSASKMFMQILTAT